MTAPIHDFDYPRRGTAYPKRRKIWPWIVGAALALALCGLGSVVLLGAGTKAAVDEIEQQQTQRTADVKITECGKSVQRLVEVSYTVTNSGTEARQYFPSFDLVDKNDIVIGSALDMTTELKPGETFKGKALGTVSSNGKVTCRLNDA